MRSLPEPTMLVGMRTWAETSIDADEELAVLQSSKFDGAVAIFGAYWTSRLLRWTKAMHHVGRVWVLDGSVVLDSGVKGAGIGLSDVPVEYLLLAEPNGARL